MSPVIQINYIINTLLETKFTKVNKIYSSNGFKILLLINFLQEPTTTLRNSITEGKLKESVAKSYI